MERVVRTDLEVFLEAVEVHLVVPVQAAASVVGIGELGLGGESVAEMEFGFGLGIGEEADVCGIGELGLDGLVWEAVAVDDFGFDGAGLEPVVEG